MQLIASLTSPFARKVRIILEEKQLEYELVQDLPFSANTRTPQFNPLGKVPVLILHDGSCLYDSRVIVEYLEEEYDETVLLPAAQRIDVRCWEALADGICDAAVNIFLESKRPKEQQSQDWIDRQHTKIVRGLDAMNDDLGTARWCSGNELSLADIAVGCALGYLDLRLTDLAWRENFHHLDRLALELAERPSFSSTAPTD
ncbi:MAG: glutathione S-transferase [Gammaproteobacteria bacterium]|nr:MAG: glutathione S-transferase [Gammaproteobacteria bacterium]